MELVALLFGVVGAPLLLYGIWKRVQLIRECPRLWSYSDDPMSTELVYGQVSPDVFLSLSKANETIVAGILCLCVAILFAVWWVCGKALQAM